MSGEKSAMVAACGGYRGDGVIATACYFTPLFFSKIEMGGVFYSVRYRLSIPSTLKTLPATRQNSNELKTVDSGILVIVISYVVRPGG
jgi:hypothetical protein